jgi:hypothetical protein
LTFYPHGCVDELNRHRRLDGPRAVMFADTVVGVDPAVVWLGLMDRA